MICLMCPYPHFQMRTRTSFRSPTRTSQKSGLNFTPRHPLLHVPTLTNIHSCTPPKNRARFSPPGPWTPSRTLPHALSIRISSAPHHPHHIRSIPVHPVVVLLLALPT